MKLSIIFGLSVLFLAGPQASATSEIMIKANHGRPEAELYNCSSCHQVTPSRLHKFRFAELTETGRTWAPKKKWWQKLFGC